jgi:hypothetical protein
MEKTQRLSSSFDTNEATAKGWKTVHHITPARRGSIADQQLFEPLK